MIVLPAGLSAVLYLVAARRDGRWPAWRSLAWLAGLAVLVAALASPLHAAGEERLSAHMVQHLLLTLAAAPLLVLGAPVALALRTLRGSARRDLGRIVSSAPARALVHPAAGWAALTLATVVTHGTGLYDLALRDPLVHEAEHVLFLVTAMVWWTGLIGFVPGHSALGPIGRLAWLMAAMPVMAGVGAWLAGAETVQYASYGTSAAALADQARAGSLMWSGGTMPMALAAFGLAMEGLWREERRQRRRERVQKAAA